MKLNRVATAAIGVVPRLCPRRFIPRRRPRRPYRWRTHGWKKKRPVSWRSRAVLHDPGIRKLCFAPSIPPQTPPVVLPWPSACPGQKPVPPPPRQRPPCRCPHPIYCPRHPRNKCRCPTLVGLRTTMTCCSFTTDPPLKNALNVAIDCGDDAKVSNPLCAPKSNTFGNAIGAIHPRRLWKVWPVISPCPK